MRTHMVIAGVEIELVKPGKHGMLHRFRVRYNDPPEGYAGSYLVWAYDADHAIDGFYDSNDGGWSLVAVERLR